MDLLQENEHLQEELQKLAAKVNKSYQSKCNEFLFSLVLTGYLRTFACYSTNHIKYYAGGNILLIKSFQCTALTEIEPYNYKTSIFGRPVKL